MLKADNVSAQKACALYDTSVKACLPRKNHNAALPSLSLQISPSEKIISETKSASTK